MDTSYVARTPENKQKKKKNWQEEALLGNGTRGRRNTTSAQTHTSFAKRLMTVKDLLEPHTYG